MVSINVSHLLYMSVLQVFLYSKNTQGICNLRCPQSILTKARKSVISNAQI